MADVITAGYIISFGLLIYGLMGLTGPKTAVRGNLVAAAGMGLAILATGLRPGMGHWWLIAVGLVTGAVVGVPAARQVKMTAMPQMVALFNGVGGGAVALISWVEFNSTHGYHGVAGYVAVTSLFAAIVGSVSFWGSLIAFGKLQEVLPGKPIGIGRLQQPLNLLLLVVAVVCAVLIGGGAGARPLIAGVLLPGAVLGVMVVLPIDHPLNRHDGPISITQLKSERFVLRRRGSGTGFYEQVFSICAAAGFSPQIAQEALEATTTLGLVAAGVGITVAPRALQSIRVHDVVWRELAETQTASRILLIYNRGSTNPLRDKFIGGFPPIN